MRGRRILFIGVLLAILGGVGLLFAISIRDRGQQDPGGTAEESPAGPKLLLREVEVRELGGEGEQYRLTSDRASYLVLARKLSADGVTLFLPGPSGEMVVRAPKAYWEMDAGRIHLAEGGTAENSGGWSAVVDEASLFLPDSLMTAEGKARLSGPGLSVTGDHLAWRWRDGKIALENPRSRVDPSRVPSGTR